jgi:hypothetical protein
MGSAMSTKVVLVAMFALCVVTQLTMATTPQPSTNVLDGKSYLDVFIGKLESELKAELKELRETPEKPFIQPYVIDNAPAFDENLTKTNELLGIATLHYQAQDNVVLALENALKKAKMAKAKHDLKYEKAVETVKSSKYRLAKLTEELHAIINASGERQAERLAVYNASKEIAEREYLANIQEQSFGLEDRITSEKIKYDSAVTRVENRVRELQDEKKQILKAKDVESKKAAEELRNKPSDVILNRIADNAKKVNDEYISEKARKKKIKQLQQEIILKEKETKKANEALFFIPSK